MRHYTSNSEPDFTCPVCPPKMPQVISAAGSELTGAVVALGGKTKDVGPTMLTDGTNNVISAMKRLSKAKVGWG